MPAMGGHGREHPSSNQASGTQTLIHARANQARVYGVLSIASLVLACAQPLNAAPFESHSSYLSANAGHFVKDINDVDTVFYEVLKQLPKDVLLHTTENYSYFTFVDGGVEYQGNIRIEEADVNQLNFAYSVRPAPWISEPTVYYKLFKNDRAFQISKLAPDKFGINFRGLSRVFHQANVAGVRPPDGMLKDGETFLGESIDESGLQFFLVYDEVANTAIYILDESSPVTDKLESAKDESGADMKDLEVGLRSGFVFVRDRGTSRRRLVGIHAGNADRNNYFDGPFDQLPDSYEGPMSIRDMFARINPKLAEQMDKKGNFLNDAGSRAVVNPYLSYNSLSDMQPLLSCIDIAADDVTYRKCFKKFVGF